ncbi:hypothetical protein [Cellulomonas sp. NTE-D12]
MDLIEQALPLYDQYLEISRVANLTSVPASDRPEFYISSPAPLTLIVTSH